MGLIVRNKKFYGNNPLQNLVNYSTDEQVIGTWIDGKPIYQKTIAFGTLPNATEKQVAHNISDIDVVIGSAGCSWKSDRSSCTQLPYVNPSSATSSIGLYANSTVIGVVTGTDRRTFTITYVTLQYTKTTD